jgi:predicted nucleic acid-binding protein
MRVVVDTSVWSLALRRAEPSMTAQPYVLALADLLVDSRAVIIGPIRQELLSGIQEPAQFDRLVAALAIFPDEPIEAVDYPQAAAFSNECRRHGVQGAATDFLICAVAHRVGLAIFTTDRDFANYASHVPIRLFEPDRG